MLLLSPLRAQQQHKDENINRGGDHQMESFSNVVDFSDFSGGNLLDSIDFDDLFIGIDSEMDVLPDLEMDSEMLAEFSVSGGDDQSDLNTSVEKWEVEEAKTRSNAEEDDHQKVASSGSATTEFKYSSSDNSSHGGDEIVSKRDESVGGGAVNTSSSSKEGTEKTRKSSSSSAQSKNSHGKRKVKVDWTPELHRRFVQAVEQLGVDKAVPSRILELMGIDCLTRHNIASHLQKYRSHRKHLLAREAEPASWTQRRQMYGSAAGGGGGERPASEMGPWVASPTMGFPPPPMTPMHHQGHRHHHHHQFRPLHVWGYRSLDQSMLHMWPPKHLAPFPPPQPPPSWPPAPPPLPDPSYWHHHHQRAPPNTVQTPGTPCFPRQMATTTTHPPTTRFTAAPPVPGTPPHHHASMYKLDHGGIGVPAGQSASHPLVDFQPSKESIDAAIGDVLSKPWLPLPLGLKPPSTDSVMGELQRQGIPKIPPSFA